MIGKEKELVIEFQQEEEALSNSKIGLIKETLETIYTSFNKIMITD